MSTENAHQLDPLPRGPWLPADLAQRLSGIFDGGRSLAFEPARVYPDCEDRWTLDAGNNWQLHIEGQCFFISYRYGKPAAFWKALRVVVVDLLDLREAKTMKMNDDGHRALLSAARGIKSEAHEVLVRIESGDIVGARTTLGEIRRSLDEIELVLRTVAEDPAFCTPTGILRT